MLASALTLSLMSRCKLQLCNSEVGLRQDLCGSDWTAPKRTEGVPHHLWISIYRVEDVVNSAGAGETTLTATKFAFPDDVNPYVTCEFAGTRLATVRLIDGCVTWIRASDQSSRGSFSVVQ